MKINTTRGAQNVLSATYEFDILDTVEDVNGVARSFKDASVVAKAIFLPINAVVVGGDVVVETASDDSGTATISVGDSSVPNRHANAVNLKAAARTALTLTGYKNTGGLDLRVTLANAGGDATVGKARVTVQYVIVGRITEVQTH